MASVRNNRCFLYGDDSDGLKDLVVSIAGNLKQTTVSAFQNMALVSVLLCLPWGAWVRTGSRRQSVLLRPCSRDKFVKLLCSFVFKEKKHEKCIDTVSEQMYNTNTDTVSALK